MNNVAFRLQEHLRANGVDVSTVDIRRRNVESVLINGQPPSDDTQRILKAFDWSEDANKVFEEDRNPERRDIQKAAANAIQSNQAYLAIANPTPAQMRQQLDSLTKQNNAIIRRVVQLE